MNNAPLIWDTVSLDEESLELVIIDQTLLPGESRLLRLHDAESIREAICSLRVRGAPAIGVAAAIGIAVLAARLPESGQSAFFDAFLKQKEYLASARPTAVNLTWALDRMERAALSAREGGICKIKARLLEEARRIRDEDIEICRRIGEHGLALLRDGDGVLTHCNAGHLATVRYGTALAPLHLGTQRGMRFKVFSDETRPLLQGARLSCYELTAGGVDTTVICDNMAASVMAKGWVQAVLVGCDRVAANGDTANKIGTLGVAVLARHFGVPFYVCGPTSTVDLACPDGAGIQIEERSGGEVTQLWYSKPMAPREVKVFNPAFDVTPAELITGIVTEHGVARPPFGPALADFCSRAL